MGYKTAPTIALEATSIAGFNKYTDTDKAKVGYVAVTASANLDAAEAHRLVVAGNPHGTTAAQVGADPTGTASTAITTHNAAADPHTQYLKESESNLITTVRTITANSTLLSTDQVVLINAAGVTSLSLPTITAAFTNKVFYVKRIDNNAFLVFLASTPQVDGYTTQVRIPPFGALTIFCDGTTYRILNKGPNQAVHIPVSDGINAFRETSLTTFVAAAQFIYPGRKEFQPVQMQVAIHSSISANIAVQLYSATTAAVIAGPFSTAGAVGTTPVLLDLGSLGGYFANMPTTAEIWEVHFRKLNGTGTARLGAIRFALNATS